SGRAEPHEHFGHTVGGGLRDRDLKLVITRPPTLILRDRRTFPIEESRSPGQQLSIERLRHIRWENRLDHERHVSTSVLSCRDPNRKRYDFAAPSDGRPKYSRVMS